MSKFKVGDKVILTHIPELAKRWGVDPGVQAEIIPVRHTESEAYAKEVGLVMIRIITKGYSNCEFWWSEKHLELAVQKQRYKIGKFAGRRYLLDTCGAMIFGFGPELDFSLVCNQQHRATYTEVDAIHLIEWLNERAADYPKGPWLYGFRSDGAIVRVGV